MSGHSHAKTVKRVKDANDAKRGKIFSKIGRLISLAAKEGENPDFNPKLKSALEEAKKYNVPKDNVERAIKKGSGKDTNEQLEEVVYEAIGPFGINIIIEGITDNKNRALAEIKQVLQKHNGKLTQEGSLKWLFERKGIIKIAPQKNQNKERLELLAIEAGAEETQWKKDGVENTFLQIITSIDNLESAKNILAEKGAALIESGLVFQANQTTKLSKQEYEAVEKLFSALDETEVVQKIYSNIGDTTNKNN